MMGILHLNCDVGILIFGQRISAETRDVQKIQEYDLDTCAVL